MTAEALRAGLTDVEVGVEVLTLNMPDEAIPIVQIELTYVAGNRSPRRDPPSERDVVTY